MKASIKFREEQKPLVRAKIPLNIANLPFQSSIVAGESKELSLNLSTFFNSGPSLKVAYKPNDSLNPFTLVFRTGIGHFGSPINSPMSMSAEFNLVGTQKSNPRFFIHFKPKVGDFCIKKSQSSEFDGKSVKSIQPKSKLDDDVLVETTEKFYGKRIGVLPETVAASGVVGGLLSGVEATARSVLPVANRALVSFRWGVRFPGGVKSDLTAGILAQELPVLVMNKIGIEHVADGDKKESNKVVSGLNLQGSDGVGETYLVVKRQLEVIQVENEMLRKTMNDLKSEFAAGKWTVPTAGGGELGKYREGERGAKPSGGRVDRWNNGGDKKSSEFNGKSSEGVVNGELKKVAKDTAGA